MYHHSARMRLVGPSRPVRARFSLILDDREVNSVLAGLRLRVSFKL
jgi:hypothetical protein